MNLKLSFKMICVALLMAAAVVPMLVKCQPPLHKGWYRTKWLKNHGYTVPVNAPKSIYIRPTSDSLKANIKSI